ncbi:MAG: PHP domain-containing protein [Candidatus Xiphinematobacter sp.]|nr:MAG: PHP domain-containing protein [Candidatus Xiphinematobacter sp.]
MLYRFDFHTHSFFSTDASSSPEQLVEAAKSRGLSGIAITDHDNCQSLQYCIQNRLVREDGLPVDNFLIFPGVEVSTAEGHLLCIGGTIPNRKGAPALQVAEEIRMCGGIPVPSHPFDRWRASICPEIMDQMQLEVVEVFNAAACRRKYNQQARVYATARSLGMVAGSDAHHRTAVGTCWTTLDLERLSIASVLSQLPKATQIGGRYSPFLESLKKYSGNWFRCF